MRVENIPGSLVILKKKKCPRDIRKVEVLFESPDGAFLPRVGALGERRSALRNLSVCKPPAQGREHQAFSKGGETSSQGFWLPMI